MLSVVKRNNVTNQHATGITIEYIRGYIVLVLSY